MLADRQSRFLAALHRGPDAVQTMDFDTRKSRLMLAMKAHANTISHARLRALEDSFPHLRKAMGETDFHSAIRSFVESPAAMSASLPWIGEAVADWLLQQGADASLIGLAKFEMGWLRAYHATDAVALMAQHLAPLTPEAMLDYPLVVHPATQHLAAAPSLAAYLPEISAHKNGQGIALTRPDANVQVHLLDNASDALMARRSEFATIGNLLDAADECTHGDGAQQLALGLIMAGVWMIAA